MNVRFNSSLMVMMVLAFLTTGARALEPHTRDGWNVGLAFGGATGDIVFADDSGGQIEDGYSPQIRLGHMVGDHLALGFSYAGWVYESGVLPTKYRISLQNFTLAGTWYPGRPDTPLAGFYLRGGAGLAWSAITAVEILEDEEQGHGTSVTDSGLGLEFTLGYEFRVARHTSLGFGLGLYNQSLNGDYFRKVTYASMALNLGWYW